MLPVSEFIELARSKVSGAELRSRSPLRFTASGEQAPVVVWNVCMHCNMSCPHCYAAAVSQPASSDLTHGEALRLLDELASCGVRVVIFSGGEPLLRSDLFDLLAHARKLGMAPQLSSNGVLIDEDVAARLARCGVAYVGVSIDGIAESNDRYRGLAGGYEAAIRGLRFAKSAGMATGLRTTLSQSNREQLDDLIDLAADVEADRFYLSHLVYSGRGYQIADDDLSQEETRAALLRLFERAESLVAADRGPRIVTGSNDSDGVFLLQWLERRYGGNAAAEVRELLIGRGGNSAGERILNVDSRGRVHPDQFWRAAVLGDVRRQSFKSILDHPLREQLRRRLEYLTGRCGACSERHLCRGSHRERALARYRDVWASDPACVMQDVEIGLGADAALAVR